MEALSPRDVNARIRINHAVDQAVKPSTAPLKSTHKEKDHPPPPPPEVIEPASFSQKDGVIYKTGQLLGRGGFAVCYEGQNTNTRQKYALKIVKSHMPQKKMEQKFQTELQIHSKMNQANIVEFHKAFSYQKCTYIVLELCPNGSLMDMVKKRKYITEPEVRFWTVQMAGAIKYMHGKGIIHRDLKMGNIFLDKNMNVKVGDFGLAALLMSGKDWQACRRTTLCGTPNYIAPEILSKDKSGHDHAVDIWSLGIIIFAMLTGKPPFQSATADEIYRRARERDYDWPKLNTSENFISKETKDLVSELLQAPQQRPLPDKIVQHAFFTCGWTPKSEEMTISLRERHPDQFQFPSLDKEDNLISSLRNLESLCLQCEVGPWTVPRKYTSTYREVEEEEKLGLTPAVPLAEGVVYRPFHTWLQEQVKNLNKNGESAVNILQLLKEVVSPASKKKYKNGSSLRSSLRSHHRNHAIQQREKPHSSANQDYERKIYTTSGINKKQTRSRFDQNEQRSHEPLKDLGDKLAVDMFNQLHIFDAKKDNHSEHKTHSNHSKAPFSIFHKSDIVKEVPDSKPDFILSRLRRLKVELERSLSSRSIAAETSIPRKKPVIVVKWVDYTNKYGLGYILSNGSVGSIFRAIPASPQDPQKGLNPPTCVLIRDSEKHLLNQNNPNWKDYGQLVPITGHKIEFYENRGDQGLFKAEVNAAKFKSVPGLNGEMFKLGIGQDEFDSRKKERIAIWRKFGNYMTQYGRDADYPLDENPHQSNLEADSSAATFVNFYQRWGDVGCWGFDDGRLQFNFPDHTKIILSADGTWCDFYHLPIKAARDLEEKGILLPQTLDERQHLSYPLQTMLNFTIRTIRTRSNRQPEIDPKILDIPEANNLRLKIEFIVQCINEWTTNGGIGISDLSVEGRLRWSGARQKVDTKVPYKHVWVCVGGRATDERKVMWFDPRVPDLILPDIDH
ncbi:putative serine threonine protein kinase [Erysiphe neolycopersici]|uniref:Serine/threonine-protein kinase ATG1 n=1 Tax=Erysiphe neolycopersici TaxID=212602 RepID=A0A420HMF9_9PEZI|nr:putative serine threonine protein kinase [Erysiphe neolycopersici]